MRIAVLIDGGHLRVLARMANKQYNPAFIEGIARKCAKPDEEILRILYYDCAPYTGTAKLPVSGLPYTFSGSDAWLRDLARKDLFAVRKGTLKFRGYKPKNAQLPTTTTATDADFRPDFEQKGVDMRIGLDIAVYSANRAIERIVLITNDSDCIPAMKHARKAGLQVVLIRLPNSSSAHELREHADFYRSITWP
jgi:uncharacterized LabA/DUF88 family protein